MACHSSNQRPRLVSLIAGGACAVVTIGLVSTGLMAHNRKQSFPIDLTSLRAEVEERFKAADGNGDGALTAAELATASHRLADDNGDGLVSEAEFHTAHLGPFPFWHGQHKRRHPFNRKGTGDQNIGQGPSAFSLADANGDGQLSGEEFQMLPVAIYRARQQARFERLDGNGDDVLVFTEISPRLGRLQALDMDGDGQLTRQEARARMGGGFHHHWTQ